MNAPLAKPISLGLVYWASARAFATRSLTQLTHVGHCRLRLERDKRPLRRYRLKNSLLRRTIERPQPFRGSASARQSAECAASRTCPASARRHKHSGLESFSASERHDGLVAGQRRCPLTFTGSGLDSAAASGNSAARFVCRLARSAASAASRSPRNRSMRHDLRRASSASRTSILRSSSGAVTRSGKSSRRTVPPACMSRPSGSQPVQRQSAASAPSRRVA
jgi:hypothetical protein